MAITNISRPSTSLINPTKVVSYEIFDTLNTTFDTETRTFDQMGTNWTNQLLSTDSLLSPRSYPFLMSFPFQQTGGITNISKPI